MQSISESRKENNRLYSSPFLNKHQSFPGILDCAVVPIYCTNPYTCTTTVNKTHMSRLFTVFYLRHTRHCAIPRYPAAVNEMSLPKTYSLRAHCKQIDVTLKEHTKCACNLVMYILQDHSYSKLSRLQQITIWFCFKHFYTIMRKCAYAYPTAPMSLS